MSTFSKQLVDKCIEYFHRVHHTDISVDTANEYLHSFAKLYLAFNRPNGGGGARSLWGGEAPPVGVSDKSILGVSNT